MKQFAYTVKDENGIHARPAGLLVKEAQKFSSEISVESNGKTASLKKLFALMGLGVKQGGEIIVTAEGADETEAAAALEEFLQKNF